MTHLESIPFLKYLHYRFFRSSLILHKGGHCSASRHFSRSQQRAHKIHRTMANRAATVIENAPNELWREIFEYFNGFDLWFSFRGLNERIDAIIDLTPLDLNFQKRGTYPKFKKNIHPAMNETNTENVRSLLMNKSQEIQHFFPRYSLGSLVQLRTLHLEHLYPFDSSSYEVWQQLSRLKHLRSLKISFARSSNYETAFDQKGWLIHSIIEPDCYPSLRRFSVETLGVKKQKSVILSSNPTAVTSNIRYLSIDTLTFGDLVKLLPALGNIKSLCISDELSTGGEPAEKPPKVETPLLPKCLELEVKFCTEHTFEHVEYLLGHIPNVQRLVLWGWSQIIDAKKWESLLSTLCPKLLKLELLCLGLIGDQRFGSAMFYFEEECRVASFWQQRGVKINQEVDESETVMLFGVFFKLIPENTDL